jgi:hypothetical protein
MDERMPLVICFFRARVSGVHCALTNLFSAETVHKVYIAIIYTHTHTHIYIYIYTERETLANLVIVNADIG